MECDVCGYTNCICLVDLSDTFREIDLEEIYSGNSSASDLLLDDDEVDAELED